MMKKTLTSLIVLLISFMSYGQNMTVSGDVYDTINNRHTDHAVVMAVRLKDSVLLDYTRTDSLGQFSFDDLPIDTVELLITHPRFDDKSFFIFGSENNHEFKLPNIIMLEDNSTFDEIVILAYEEPIYFRGDTLVYVADSFDVKQNAVVEDLLKKLPGIEVDANGNVKSQGKQVSQILVDGDEFFGSDPTVATKNLAADGVESVEVYEKENEDSESGDETIQVMDLKLKEEAKKGYFGKVSGATDGQQFFEGEVLANRFNRDLKLSVFGLGSNTPRSGFGWGDMYRFGLTNEYQMTSSDGGTTYYYDDGGNNQGIPRTYKGGFYYSDKLGEKTKLGINYTYNDNVLNANGAQTSQFFLSDTTYTTDEISTSNEEFKSHAVNLSVTQTIDSLTTLTIRPRLTLNSSKQRNYNQTDFTSEDDTLIYRTDVTNNNEAENFDFSTDISLDRKFKKEKRKLRTYYKFSMSENLSNSSLLSNRSYFNSTNSNDSIDQQSNLSKNTFGHMATLRYVEPLSKKMRLEFDYNMNLTNNNQLKSTYNQVNGEYTSLDSTLSNDFENIRFKNRVGAHVVYQTKKTYLRAGTYARNVSIDNYSINSDAIHQSINNILPSLSYRYKFSNSHRFSINYRTSSQQPSVSQLQPVQDNSNPNQIRIGNPDLRPTYTHRVNVSYNRYQPLKGQYIWLRGNYNRTNDAFSNSIEYDSLGRTISQSINVNGNVNSSVSFGGGIPLFDGLFSLNPYMSADYSEYNSYINNQQNTTTTPGVSGGLELELETDSIYFYIGGDITYNNPSSTLSFSSNQPYSQQVFTTGFEIELPWKMSIEADAEYTINSQRADGYDINFLIIDASINKRFLETENLILSLMGNDLLNQNVSAQRIIENNVVIDNHTRIISRYFLLKLTLRFNNNRTKESNDFY